MCLASAANSQGETSPLIPERAGWPSAKNPKLAWRWGHYGLSGSLLPDSLGLGSDSALIHPLLSPPVSQVEVARKQTLRQFRVPSVY